MKSLIAFALLAAVGRPAAATPQDCGLAAPSHYVAVPRPQPPSASGIAEIRVAEDDGWQDVRVHGAVCRQTWTPARADASRPVTEIHWFYRRGLQALGAEMVYLDWRYTVARLPAGNGTRWIQVHSPPGEINVTIVDVGAWPALAY